MIDIEMPGLLDHEKKLLADAFVILRLSRTSVGILLHCKADGSWTRNGRLEDVCQAIGAWTDASIRILKLFRRKGSVRH